MTKNTQADKPFMVRRGRVDSVNLYEVKENELDLLENGEEANLQLNFAIFLFSLSFSGILTLSSATFKTPLLQQGFLFTTIIGFIVGTYLLIRWWIGRKSIRKVIKTIRDRISPDSILEVEESEGSQPISNIPHNNDIVKPEG
ncbi:hypothetical protein QTN47_21930 [Danxiaibacter flavus]|uniref:Uncharacterized protein n=1 Tax=Danxiaibacter flavus TaxID=3049108 RepID=A0ABV3ZKV3_9BACT|nr:hypothetical protein QNM32_21935 [Chitinophagaceae bacterium DXS]